MSLTIGTQRLTDCSAQGDCMLLVLGRKMFVPLLFLFLVHIEVLEVPIEQSEDLCFKVLIILNCC